MTLGGDHLAFGLVAGPPNVHDCMRGRRPGNYHDYCDFIRLAQYFNVVHLIGNQVCAPVELPAGTRHLDTYRANLVYSDRSYHCTAIGAGRARDGIAMMAIARGLSLEDMASAPASSRSSRSTARGASTRRCRTGWWRWPSTASPS